MPGTKNMGIYAKVTKKGASKKVTTTKYFKYSKIQSTASKKTKKGLSELIEELFNRRSSSMNKDIHNV
jgi:hypothetical protein